MTCDDRQVTGTKCGCAVSRTGKVELRELAVNDAPVSLTPEQRRAQGRQIKQGREGLGWTQPELAEAAGVSESTVSNWERGITSPMNKMTRLKRILNLDDVSDGDDAEEVLVAERSKGDDEEYLRSVDNQLLLAEVSRRFAHLPKNVVSGKPGRKYRIPPESTAQTSAGDAPNATESSG